MPSGPEDMFHVSWQQLYEIHEVRFYVPILQVQRESITGVAAGLELANRLPQFCLQQVIVIIISQLPRS